MIPNYLEMVQEALNMSLSLISDYLSILRNSIISGFFDCCLSMVAGQIRTSENPLLGLEKC